MGIHLCTELLLALTIYFFNLEIIFFDPELLVFLIFYSVNSFQTIKLSSTKVTMICITQFEYLFNLHFLKDYCLKYYILVNQIYRRNLIFTTKSSNEIMTKTNSMT